VGDLHIERAAMRRLRRDVGRLTLVRGASRPCAVDRGRRRDLDCRISTRKFPCITAFMRRPGLSFILAAYALLSARELWHAATAN
jgi:hypothetical protein